MCSSDLGDLGQIGLRLPDRADRLVDICAETSAVVGVRLAGSDSRSLRLRPQDLTSEDSEGPGLDLPLATGDAVRELVPLHPR